jgi:hypothetical protein
MVLLAYGMAVPGVVVPRHPPAVADVAVVPAEEEVQRELIRPGRAVSIDARSIRRDDDLDLHIRRHRLATLDAVAVLADGERPWYAGSEIVAVREPAART